MHCFNLVKRTKLEEILFDGRLQYMDRQERDGDFGLLDYSDAGKKTVFRTKKKEDPNRKFRSFFSLSQTQVILHGCGEWLFRKLFYTHFVRRVHRVYPSIAMTRLLYFYTEIPFNKAAFSVRAELKDYRPASGKRFNYSQFLARKTPLGQQGCFRARRKLYSDTNLACSCIPVK